MLRCDDDFADASLWHVDMHFKAYKQSVRIHYKLGERQKVCGSHVSLRDTPVLVRPTLTDVFPGFASDAG